MRKLAAAHLRDERTNHTLQPTGLVHEAYIRLVRAVPVGVARRPVGGGVRTGAVREPRGHALGLVHPRLRAVRVRQAEIWTATPTVAR